MALYIGPNQDVFGDSCDFEPSEVLLLRDLYLARAVL